MAAIDNTRTSTILSAGRITAFAQNIIGAVATWNDARITRKSLSQLTARELDDIGLSRGDIDLVVARNFR